MPMLVLRRLARSGYSVNPVLMALKRLLQRARLSVP